MTGFIGTQSNVCKLIISDQSQFTMSIRITSKIFEILNSPKRFEGVNIPLQTVNPTKSTYIFSFIVKEWAKKKLNNAECRILKIGEKKRRKKTTPVVVEQTSLEDFIW